MTKFQTAHTAFRVYLGSKIKVSYDLKKGSQDFASMPQIDQKILENKI